MERVLIVDSDKARREDWLQSLAHHGLHPEGAATSKDASFALRRTDYSAVLISDQDALEVLRTLRPHVSWTPLLVLSHIDDIDLYAALQTQGAEEVLSDELSPSEIARRVRLFIPTAA
jgi:DNA-binding response OmpR family regulator